MEAYEVLSSKSFGSICRTCLVFGDHFLIEKVSSGGTNLKNILESMLENDPLLPKQMCKNCIKLMYKTHDFLNKCKSSDKILKKILLRESGKKEMVKKQSSSFKTQSANQIKTEPINNTLTSSIEENDIKKNSDVDTDSDIGDMAELESKLSESDKTPQTKNDSDLLTEISTMKEEISNIRVKNIARLRQMAKAQLVNSNELPKNNKRTYVLRKGPPYTCITCNSSYKTHEELKKHKQETKHKKSLKYKCNYCDRKYDTYCKFEEHVRTHTGEKPNKCPTCGKCFNFKTDLKRHMVMHMEVKPYICQFCNKGFARRQYLVDHERKHTGEQLLCPFCGKGFHSYSTLTYHEKTHKGPPGCVRNPLTKDRLYQCNLCEKTLLTEQTLKAHLLLHGPRNFSCEICGKTYISKNRLQDHIKLTHQNNTFSCHLCKKEYKQKSGLEVHLKSHSGENIYPCDECGKQFACKGSLYQHKRVHTGDTKYQCKECLHICINRRHLENHLRIHTGEKPFSCIYCGKLFAQKANMQAHTKIHTGERNHHCKLCEKSFYDTRGLKKHMAVHEKHNLQNNGGQT
ncbi:unnamed protein product [Ceutorhynchus assimilis]|uniref:Uncharacterized protein n=1 Tax=Ceutorhynchus assimilis TaxID=467358 RepID=A0A9N9MB25_9CUCU|nr:unnamed protein product [Ceutorhynchus assimilis]